MSKVTLGAHLIKKKEKASKQVQKVDKRFPHPDYYQGSRENDLMLLKVKWSFIVWNQVKKRCIYVNKFVFNLIQYDLFLCVCMDKSINRCAYLYIFQAKCTNMSRQMDPTQAQTGITS